MRAYFWLSEAQGGDPDADPITVECGDGFQLTYGQLREARTGTVTAFFDSEFWILVPSGEKFSDVVLSERGE